MINFKFKWGSLYLHFARTRMRKTRT